MEEFSEPRLPRPQQSWPSPVVTPCLSSSAYLTLPRFVIIMDGLVWVHNNLFVARSIRVLPRHASPDRSICTLSSIDDWIDPSLWTVSFLAIAAWFSGSREAGRVIVNVDSFPAIAFGYLKDFVHNSQVGMFGERLVPPFPSITMEG